MEFPSTKHLIILTSIFFACIFNTCAQDLYSARGYWLELNKSTYKNILDKRTNGNSISYKEATFLEDYEAYLANYYKNMSEEEKSKFLEMKDYWDSGINPQQPTVQEDFNLRTRDRLINGVYGLYYGASLVLIAEVDEGGLGIGIPLIMAGLWQLGPVINRKKYENITLATIRAGNTGKILGLGYGASLGLAFTGESANNYKWVLGLSTVGSIALGEVAFRAQKKKQLSEGHVEMMRFYGFLGPIVTGLTSMSIEMNTQFLGGSLLAGGVAGLYIGNKFAKKYNYSPGDVDMISSLTLISTGLGLSLAAGSIESEANTGLILIPVATSVAGAIFGQRSVKGLHFTKRQGSTIKLASGGAALIGLGVVALTEADSPGWWIGVPSGLALIMHQTLFQSFKKKNMENEFKLSRACNNRVKFSMKVTPENYFANKHLSDKVLSANPYLSYPIINFKLVF